MTDRVLVVDDESDMVLLFRQQFRRELKDGRLEFDFAFSGAEALDKLSECFDRSPVLLVSDINMPGMNGLDLLLRIKADRPELPVLMITAYGDADTRRIALERGASGLLTKPIEFAALKAEINARAGRIGQRP